MQTRAKTRTLAELGLTATNASDVRVTGLSVDSRDVKEGHLFAALPGTNVHGAEFIQFALRMKAAAILTDREGASLARDVLVGSAMCRWSSLKNRERRWPLQPPFGSRRSRRCKWRSPAPTARPASPALRANFGPKWGPRRSVSAPPGSKGPLRLRLRIPRPSQSHCTAPWHRLRTRGSHMRLWKLRPTGWNNDELTGCG